MVVAPWLLVFDPVVICPEAALNAPQVRVCVWVSDPPVATVLFTRSILVSCAVTLVQPLPGIPGLASKSAIAF